MHEFVSGSRLNQQVRAVLQGKSARCAVAFWGRGARDLFGKDIREAQIICNLESGATNPNELEKLIDQPGFHVRQCDTLHAKVYIGDTRAVVTSANASANGLGLEAIEQETWIEAGIVLDEIEVIRDWFETFWRDENRSREITPEDIKRAREAWRMRQIGRPSVGSFASFDPGQERPPLIVLYQIPAKWDYNEPEIKRQLNDANIDEIKQRIEMGFDPDGLDNLSILQNRWVLGWQRTQAGYPSRRSRPVWVYIGHTVLRGAWHWHGEHAMRDILLPEVETPPRPFEIQNDGRFFSLFTSLLGEARYQLLRSDSATWNEVEATGDEFWRDLHARYIEFR